MWVCYWLREWRSLRACKRTRNKFRSSYRNAFRQPLFGWCAQNSSQHRDCCYDLCFIFLTGTADGSSRSTTLRHAAVPLFFFAFKWQHVMESDEETYRSPFFRLKRKRERETEREGGTINIPSGIRVIFFFLYRKRNQFLEFLWLTEKHARLYSVLCSVCIVSRGYFRRGYRKL